MQNFYLNVSFTSLWGSPQLANRFKPFLHGTLGNITNIINSANFKLIGS
jgi:hypothetical protein